MRAPPQGGALRASAARLGQGSLFLTSPWLGSWDAVARHNREPTGQANCACVWQATKNTRRPAVHSFVCS
jgi:hypothetical protein